MVKLGR
jgi:hypothetical protein